MAQSYGNFARLVLGASLILACTPAYAERHGGPAGGGVHTAQPARPAEPERQPLGYPRLERPQGLGDRPQQLDRERYNHNFRAEQAYHIGPYHAPAGFRYRRWSYGEMLPGIYWQRNYWLMDYWLFGLDMPPLGYEWVRYGPDALMVNIATGEVVQVIYGRFL